MKLCKKLFSFILVLSIMLSSVSAFAAPNANESSINEYNLAPGTTVICVEASCSAGVTCLNPPVVHTIPANPCTAYRKGACSQTPLPAS